MTTIIGTAHVSQQSVDEVRQKILELKPDLVAVELCEARYRGLTEQRDIPIAELIRSENFGIMFANVVLSFLQRRLGEEVGVKPGKEMLTAIETAKEIGADVALIDRDIRITLARAMASLSFFEKLRVLKEMLVAFLSEGETQKQIDELKSENSVSKILEEFKRISPSVFQVLVEERDAYMAQNLLKLSEKYRNIVAVVGAGHRQGMEAHLGNPSGIPETKALLEVPKKGFSVGSALKYGIPTLIVAIFALALYRGVALGQPIELWVLYHSVPTFIAVLLAGGSLIAALVGMLAAPITAIHPLLAAGWFAGAVEIKVRNVTVGDVSAMFKTASFRELLSNRAFKVLLVVAFANLGSSIGTFVSFPKVILPLIRNIIW